MSVSPYLTEGLCANYEGITKLEINPPNNPIKMGYTYRRKFSAKESLVFVLTSK